MSNQADQMGERISDLEDRNREIVQFDEEGKLRF